MKSRHLLLGVCLILVALSLAYAADDGWIHSSLSILTDKSAYALNETVNITVVAPDNTSSDLIIKTPSGELLSLLHNQTGSFSTRYIPDKAGPYTASCEFDFSTTMEANFSVAEAGPAGDASNSTEDIRREALRKLLENASVKVNESECSLGGEISIGAEAPENVSCRLSISTPSEQELVLMSNRSGSFSTRYTPKEEGPHTVRCEFDFSTTMEANFTVVAAPAGGVGNGTDENDTGDGERPGLPKAVALRTVNASYEMGEEVVIVATMPENVSCRLTVVTPLNESFMLLSNRSGSFSTRYSPKESGPYTAVCDFTDFSTTMEANFTVAGGPGWAVDNLTANDTEATNASMGNVTNATGIGYNISDGTNKSRHRTGKLPASVNISTSKGFSFGASIRVMEDGLAELRPERSPVKRISFVGLNLSRQFELGIEEVPKEKIPEKRFVKAYAIDPSRLEFERAFVTVTATGSQLYKCAEWNFTEQTCEGSWELYKTGLVPGENYTFIITPDDPAFGEGITVINVQSHPTVGGEWIVRFNTTGQANLSIRGVDGTTWSDSDESEDLRFLELRCGEEVLEYEWVNGSVFIEDYACDKAAYEVSKVLTPGKHTLEFSFGDDVAYAHNQVSWWDDTWGFRKRLNITNNVASVLREGYSINLTLDTNQLVETNKLLANCSDLRIVWWNGTDHVELDRVNETACNTSATQIWFRLQENISASGWNASYYMYYDNPSADSPPDNKSNVYYLWEDFEDQSHPFTNGNLNPSVTTGAKKNGNYGLYGNGAAGYRRAVKPENLQRGMMIEGWVWSGPGTANADLPGLLFGMVPATERNGYQMEIDWRNSGTSQIRLNWNSGSPLDTCLDVDTDTWYYLRTAWDESGNIDGTIFNEDGSVFDTLSASDSTYTSGYYGPGAYREGRWDDILVRLYFSQEPTVALGSQEANKIAVTLVSPSPGYTTNQPITFNCSAITGSGKELENISLYGNWSGGWHRNETNTTVTGRSNWTAFTKTITTDGTYEWNCLAYDNSTGDAYDWGDVNYTFTIDANGPTVSIITPSGTFPDTTPTVNVSFGETVEEAWYNIDQGQNITLCSSCSSIDDVYLNLAEGSYTIYVFANDSFGNEGTDSSAFTIDMNGNYYDTYNDPSSIEEYNEIEWERGNMSFTGVAEGWWNSSWSYRKRLNITNSMASVLEANHSINFTLDTNSLVDADKLLANCSDLRIVWWNGTDHVELDRVNETACNTSATQIWFRLQENISASGWNASYYMYYDNPSAGSPPENRSNVYLFWDDFNDGNNDGWTEHNGDWYVTGNTYYQASDLTTYVITSIGDSGWSDYILETRINIASGGATGGFAGVLFRFQDVDNHYAVILDDRDPDSIWIRQWISGSYTTDPQEWDDVSMNRDAWYDLKVEVYDCGSNDCIAAYFNGYRHAYNYTQYDSGEIALMMHGTQAYYDNIKVRRYASSEPSVSALAETYKGGGGSSNFTSTVINTTDNITGITNVTWSEFNTDANNNITVEISVDNGNTWYDAANGSPITGFTENNSLVYRVTFTTNGSKRLALLDMNISWSEVPGDSTPPSLDWNWTDINSTINTSSTTVCVNASETVNCTLHFAGTDYVNSTSSTNVCWTVTGLSKGNHTPVNATCDDASGNEANTSNAWVYARPDMWHDFCGNISGIIVLRNVSVVYNWTWSGDGNIYAYSSNADIDWGSLVALGRTAAGDAATDDFEEVDEVLETSSYINNTNITFSTDGSSPKNTTSFTINTQTVTDVPIVNSTDTWSFITGILWDSSDTVGDNEFDSADNEDLVFVAKINRTASSACSEGANYEILLPDTLDTYKGGASVSFSVEYVN